MSNPSTQLRALEWEIAEINAQPLPVSTNRKNTKRKAAVCDVLLTLAKELEAALAHEVEERDYARKELVECNKDTSAEIQSLRTENATLKRRLDEAMNVANRLATVAKHHRARGQKVGKKAIQSYDNLLKANPEYSPHERFRNRATPAA